MIWIFADRKSSGAKALVGGLVKAGHPAKRWRSKKKFIPRAGDLVIAWGESPPIEKCKGAMVVNAKQIHSKIRELCVLADAGVPIPPMLMNKPSDSANWLGRNAHHTGGLDLLKGTKSPTYWVKKLDIVQEYRVHIFRKPEGELVSIRSGSKIVRDDIPVEKIHPWIRSWDGGWKISYGSGNHLITKEIRALARKAVEALGLDFGAVDMGKTVDGKLVVFEVNRAPGTEGGTVDAYVNAITRLLPTDKSKAA